MTRDNAHGRKRGRIADASSCDLLLDHGVSLRGEVGVGRRGLGVGAGSEKEES
jgi:hypothetical protein